MKLNFSLLAAILLARTISALPVGQPSEAPAATIPGNTTEPGATSQPPHQQSPPPPPFFPPLPDPSPLSIDIKPQVTYVPGLGESGVELGQDEHEE